MHSQLAKKLGIKEGNTCLVLNEPIGFIQNINPLPVGAKIESYPDHVSVEFDLVLLFATDSNKLAELGDMAISSRKTTGNLWIAYPKKSAKTKSDLTRDYGWGFLDSYKLTGISNIAINEVWSALRFKYSEDGISHNKRMEIYMSHKAKPEEKIVVVPKDFNLALTQNLAVLSRFESFAYTHKKEYVRWIESAKKQETRDNRIIKAIEMIGKGEKFS